VLFSRYSQSKYSQPNRAGSGLALVIYALAVGTACGQIGALNPVLAEGRQFAHSIQLPASFRAPDSDRGARPLLFDHYLFRISARSPGVLLVAACKYDSRVEICSTNSFAIDTEHGYGAREASAGEWEAAAAVVGQKDLRSPYRRSQKEEDAKPANLKPVPIEEHGGEHLGYKYRGKEYLRRGDWIVSLNFADSEDGKLVVLAGVDKRKFPNQEPAYVSAEVFTRLSGLVTVDVFASDPSRRIVALDLDSHTNVNMARRRVSLVNSRWLAIGLDASLQNMLLFDFKSIGGQ
jgi:hypothetical protein